LATLTGNGGAKDGNFGIELTGNELEFVSVSEE
jgi:hypothetical protein